MCTTENTLKGTHLGTSKGLAESFTFTFTFRSRVVLFSVMLPCAQDIPPNTATFNPYDPRPKPTYQYQQKMQTTNANAHTTIKQRDTFDYPAGQREAAIGVGWSIVGGQAH